jgi:hypothetical protein
MASMSDGLGLVWEQVHGADLEPGRRHDAMLLLVSFDMATSKLILTCFCSCASLASAVWPC